MELAATTPDRGRLYWIIRNSLLRSKSSWQRHRGRFLLILAGIALALLIARAWVQPCVLALRIYSFEMVISIIGLAVFSRFKSRLRWRGWSVLVGLIGLGVANYWYFHWSPHQYLTLYLRYRTLQIRELDELPTTDHERIQPLHAIRVMAKEAMTEVEQTSDPYYVLVDGQYRWTMSIEPSFLIPRLFGNVGQVLSVSATSLSPSFSFENRSTVSFPVGEKLLLGKNAHVSTIRSFGLRRFLSYSPADVKYVKDDQGNWVELVALVRWRGLFFPQPEFGGVQVIRQSSGGLLHWLQLLLFGEGEWIPPEAIVEHKYLRGQHLVPYEVSRYAAQSFRFQEGFLSPLPGYHQGDVRIPDLPGDANDQPFTTFFRFRNHEGEEKLYHYFALEPFEEVRQGLNTSVFYPADGVGPTLTYSHSKHNEALVGVSTIAAKVMESRKLYDWTRNRPAENRPYIKWIDGKLRFMWLTTVVTYKTGVTEGSDYIAGTTPEIALTDALYRQVVWMDPHHSIKLWADDLKRELASIWKGD